MNWLSKESEVLYSEGDYSLWYNNYYNTAYLTRGSKFWTQARSAMAFRSEAIQWAKKRIAADRRKALKSPVLASILLLTLSACQYDIDRHERLSDLDRQRLSALIDEVTK